MSATHFPGALVDRRAALIMLALVLFVPFLRDLFKFGPLHGDDLAIAAGAGLGCFVVAHWAKRLPVLNPQL